MFKKTLLALLVAGTSFSSFANWTGGLNYIDISDSGDLNLGVLAASVGYKYDYQDNIKIVPEFRLGTGVRNDTTFGVDVEVDRFMSLSVRGEYDFNNGLYVFAAPAYTNIQVEVSTLGVSASDDEWELDVNLGLGYAFNDKAAFEVSFEDFDGADMISAGFVFGF